MQSYLKGSLRVCAKESLVYKSKGNQNVKSLSVRTRDKGSVNYIYQNTEEKILYESHILHDNLQNDFKAGYITVSFKLLNLKPHLTRSHGSSDHLKLIWR